MFSVRVVTVDHYLSKPIVGFYGNEETSVKEWQEPVIRIFGATNDGIKTCVHVHGVYPYMYIPYKGGINPERDALLLGAALDEALKTSFNPKVFRYVHKVILISGIPLYGYHSKHRKFFKIYFFNPHHIRKASELLLSGAILGQKFQPHEAHIPYALQFLMDYNIYGMSFVTFSKVKYRRNREKPDSMRGIREEDIFCSDVKKMTFSHLEIDALATDIVDRIGHSATIANPGLRAIWEYEKDIRRRQNKASPITVPQSQSRPDPKICPTELMYRNLLAEKLRPVSVREAEATMANEERMHVYPAEVREDEEIMEASTVAEGLECPRAREEVDDVSSLIDERILREIVGTQEKSAESESEEDEVEADSVLGRNQRAEEGAELEDEEGVDMTQPLELEESDVCDAEGSRHEPGRGSSGSSEEGFWRSMAEKIHQLDGAEESSSDSDVEAVPSGSASEERTSDGALECSSTWSTNIMSILSEDSGCPTPSTVCQTPRTFWSNYSPNWLPHDQDDCNWDGNGEPFLDMASKTAPDNFCDFPTAPKDLSSGEPYLDFFNSSDTQYFPSSAVTLLCGLASTASPAPTVAAPATELCAPAITSASLCDTPGPSLSEERSSLDGRVPLGRKPETERQKFLQVLKSFAGRKVPSEDQCCHLTLKQYIKDCREIVSVDFKNLCNQEMIIIEYKSRNKKSLQNKYLIKPLEKFLENWNSAERRVNDGLSKNVDVAKVKRGGGEVDEGRNVRSVINVVESKFGDASRVQSVRNRLTVKSMEILPEDGSGRGRRYNVNGNVISEGKIKMKLIKSRRENVEEKVMEETLKSERMEKRRNLGVKNRRGRGCEGGRRDGCKESKRKRGRVGKRAEWKSFSELDSKLINEINSSFEEYFKSLVKRKNLLGKRKKDIMQEGSEDENEERDGDDDDDEDGDDDDYNEDDDEQERELVVEEHKEESSEDEKGCGSSVGKMAVGKIHTSRSADPIKFVTRFLSTFSRMPDVPPFSVTISLGSPRTSAPVEMNFEPPGILSRKEVKYYSKKRRRKIRMENVDGPADGSSSSDSGSGDSKGKTRGPKRRKKEAFYKPLKVVVYGSPCGKEVAGRKRKVAEEDEKAQSGKVEAGHFSGDCSGVFREEPECWPLGSEEKEKSSSESLVKGEKKLADLNCCSVDTKFQNSEEVFSEPNEEADFINESDEELKSQRSGSMVGSSKGPPVTGKSTLRRIPQADTEAFTSSDDDELKRIRNKLSFRKSFFLPAAEKLLKNAGTKVPLECQNTNDSKPLLLSSLTTEMSPAHSAQPSPNPAAPPHLQTFEREHPIPTTSLSISPDADGQLLPLALSDDPLLASRTDSPQPLSSQLLPVTSHLTEQTDRKKRLSESFCQSSEPSNGARFSAGKRFCEKWKSEGRQRVASDRMLGARCIVPEQRPISRKEVIKSMQHYGITESEEKAAFYSDPLDVTKVVEVGPRVLKIENRSPAGLKGFKSSLEVVGTEERRNLMLGEKKIERCWLVGENESTIVPLRQPPSSKAVLQWLHRKNESDKKEEGGKVMEPISSGQKGDSREEVELSVIPNLGSDEGTNDSLRAEEGSSGSWFGAGKSSLAEVERKGTELECKEEPLSKVKRRKRLSTAKKLEEIPEDAGTTAPIPHSSSSSPHSHKQDKGSSENSFQIRGVTIDNTFGWTHSVENLQNLKANATHQYMDMLVVELHVQTRKDFRPDPDHDPIRALFYAIAFDSPDRTRQTGVIVVGDGILSNATASGLCIHHVPTEKVLIETLLAFVRDWDPEILAGYEIEMHSWGYLVQRAFVLDINLLLLLGRVAIEDSSTKNLSLSCSPTPGAQRDDAEDIPRSVRHMKIAGRIVLDIWRVLRHEVSLTSYSFENVMYHLAHERHPLLSYERLSHYWENPVRPSRHIVVDHYATRVVGVIRILDQLDFISRTSELSRLFGIQFFEVLSRGSQYRVESMMLRLAKPLNYIPASPSVAQRASMRAPASLPLILEPESLFYTDPLIVLDFQSLYPSIIIAYNYCFSTCLGRVDKLGGREPFEFGCTQLQIAPEELQSLENEISISPAGVVFVKPSVRRGVLPTMLAEILETRLMVKKSMKDNKDDKLLQKVLFSRQLGLKLIANVTYGYTAANFSGRMPCNEVGDSVVSKGRETLHRAIQMVESTPNWGARVVYGDTDSIFVQIPGRSREEAFKIGAEIAEAVTQDNPRPVKLKLEKVYHPSILQTKKRYLGYMYESPEQSKPVFEAKGIETVRRDGCPAVGKVLEKALRILFDTRDVSLVRKYTVRQFAKLFEGRVNVQDLIFAREYRGRKGYRAGACVPALHLAKQWTQYDKRAEPRVKERVPYVIVSGPPGVPLIRLVRSPKDLFSDPGLRINATYYITKALIPVLQRCFSLMGVDVMSWYATMPRKLHKNYKWTFPEGRKGTTISQFFATRECIVCCQITNGPLCSMCQQRPQVSVVCLNEKIRRWERRYEGILQICRSCCGRPTEIDCISLDCPVLYRRMQVVRALEEEPPLRELLTRYL